MSIEQLEEFIKDELGWKKFSVRTEEQMLKARRVYWGEDLKGVILLYGRKTIKYDDLNKIAKKCGFEAFIQVGHGVWNDPCYYAQKEAFIIWLVEI